MVRLGGCYGKATEKAPLIPWGFRHSWEAASRTRLWPHYLGGLISATNWVEHPM